MSAFEQAMFPSTVGEALLQREPVLPLALVGEAQPVAVALPQSLAQVTLDHVFGDELGAPLLDEVDGVTELVCHPGIGEPELHEAYDWGYAWEAETNALCDPLLRDAIKSRGIELITPVQVSSRA